MESSSENKNRKMEYAPEVLAPAGDMECLKAAVAYGADAVYLAGKTFGMRAAPQNFDDDQLRQAAEYCHSRNVNIYVTCNTLPRSGELARLPAFLELCQDIGIDALIAADLGVISMAKKYAPDVSLHISTQLGVVNYATAVSLYEMGASRVVTARELSLAEIADIRRNVPKELEIEAFVHGAMCMSVSGRCLLSNYMTGRDANRGGCAQPCRWEYDLVERNRPDKTYSIQQDGEGSYIFNARDLNMISHIPQLAAAGVSSLKIEGRAKSAYYVASTVSAYRRAVDFHMEHPGEALPKDILEETEKISHREYSTGFYFGEEPGQNTKSGGYIRDYEVVAVCLGRENGMVKLKQRNRFFKGAAADVLQPSGKNISLALDEIYNSDMEEISVAPHAEMIVYLKTDLEVETGAYFRIEI